MRHPLRWLIAGVTIVVLAAIGFGAWYVFGDSAPAKPKLNAAPIDAGGPATPAGAWKVAPGPNVYVGYRMTEVFAGDIVHKTAVGRTPAVSGTMTIAAGKVTQADVVGQMQQLASNRAARDNYIHSHAIDSDSYPTAAFRLTTPITLPQPSTKGAEIDVQAAGTLTLHGVTRPITIPLKTKWSGDTIQVVGTAPIVLADYQIQPPDTGVVKVDNHGSLELSLTFVRG